MLSKLRNFSKSRLSGVLVFIIIIPFVMWGMGSVFSGGNTNIIAKINNQNISTEELIESLNSKGIDLDYLKKNIDKNILEEILSELISKNILINEIEKMNINVSDQSLVKKIKKDKKFLDNEKRFSRIKYEKFLIENNLTAVNFEKKLKDQELQKKLFYYISGGVKTPKFIINRYYSDENKKISVDYINLENIYKKDFSDKEIDDFINKNTKNLEKEYIDFTYSIIKPESLTNSKEFSEIFFKKIDEIENLIIEGQNINKIKNKYNLDLNEKLNFIFTENEIEVENEIYKNRNKDQIQLIEKSDFFLLYQIDRKLKRLPSTKDKKFKEEILNNLKLKAKFEFNKNLNEKIQNKTFNDDDFIKLKTGDMKIKNVEIKSIKDINIFTTESIKFIYTMPKNSFLMISDLDQNIYLAKIKDLEIQSIDYEDENYKNYSQISNVRLINNLFTSYDQHLNNKYEVKIYDNNLKRVKDYYK